ncbi:MULTISPECIES: GlxA family transcriptional regulator [Rhodomicrobium]|uniref:GlxA family transcriptional regulator n=1 Tax=Rhodomicrobium TaxID=1068 RepID=UPI000B4B4878|nr:MULTISPECIES: GlxA family transcriptional regulator [Rhodomicrobium]
MREPLQSGAGLPARRGAPLSVGFILVKRFTLCAFANFVDVLRLAADEGDRSRPIRCNWSVISPDMMPISSSCGVSIQPQQRLGDPRRFDYIVVVGGLLSDLAQGDPRIDAFLRLAAAHDIPLVGLCTGPFVLHRAGLMDGYRCCVSWFHHNDFLEAFDGLLPVSDQIFVVDRNRLTCSGGASTAHLAAYLVERHVGRAQAMKSLHIMMIHGAAVGETPQPGMPLDPASGDPLVQRVLLVMQRHLDAPLTISRIARLVGLDKRRIERRFRAVFGRSPSEVYTEMRLGQARYLIETTGRSITAIAAECGFCDSSHLSRTFRRKYGLTPARHRGAAASIGIAANAGMT